MRRVFQSFKRSPYQSFAAFMVLFFTLFLFGVLLTTVSFLYGLLSYVEGQPQVTVFFDTEAEDAEITAFRDELKTSPKVSAVEYISQDEAYEIYAELNQDNEILIEMTSPDILPASLRIYATEPEYLAELAASIQDRPFIDQIQFQEILVDRLLALTNAVRNAALVLAGFLGLMAVIVIVATTSFKMALRKEEIELQQLLGASKLFIMKPYLVEGVLIGSIASLIAVFTMIGVSLLATPYLTSYLQGIATLTFSIRDVFSVVVWPFNVTFFSIGFIMIWIVGVIIAFIANAVAARRYLS